MTRTTPATMSMRARQIPNRLPPDRSVLSGEVRCRGVTLDDIKRFRQPDSKCPAHPEYHTTSGVEKTTGSLRQGVASSAGMAIASRWLAERYNRPGFELFDYDVYALGGDGCMMEGISNEAASPAGHLRLSNLCWIYDSDHIMIDGDTALAFTDDVATRSIGYGAPDKQDTSAAHGEPLGADEIRKTKRFYGRREDTRFRVPDEVLKNPADGIGQRGAQGRTAWEAQVVRCRLQYPALAGQTEQVQRRELPAGLDRDLPAFPADATGLASRESSGKALNAIAPDLPWRPGDAADCSPSTKPRLTFDGAGEFEAGSCGGRKLHSGVREHAMCTIANGLALSRVRPLVSGFFIFTDYCRAPTRLVPRHAGHDRAVTPGAADAGPHQVRTCGGRPHAIVGVVRTALCRA